MAKIYDNIEVKFTEGLHGIISNVGVKRIDFCVGYFNLRGWDLIVSQIDGLPGDYIYENDDRKLRICRLLIGMHRPEEDLIRALYSKQDTLPDAEYAVQCKLQIARDFRKQLLLGVPTKKDEWTLRRLSTQMKEGKVCVKLYLKEPLHAKLYLAHRPQDNFNKIQAIMGSSNLTYSGLTKQGELNAEFGDSDCAEKLAQWFDDRWNDRFCLDITEELIKIIDESWAGEKEIPPYYIYLKTAYHLSQDARNGIKEFTLSPEFKRELFDFQQTAVKIAAKNLNNDKRNGAMIGDVVGLGKTITACAIAKIYEMTFASSTLIICPANLQDMWKKYVAKYDLKADIMSMAKPIDVDSARYYRLIIVDESHNLRNSNGKRYQNIRALIEHQDSKVLLLTATPYNKDFSDLSNQLRLFISEDQDLGIRPEEYIRSLGGEREFQRQHSDIHMRSIKAFEKSPYADDWNELMKLFLVRRTRTFIKENYAKLDNETGRKYLQFNDGSKSYFPERLPRAVKFKTEQGDQYSRLYSEEMIALMEELKLPRYGLIHFYDEAKATNIQLHEKQIVENLSRAGKRMMGFCKSTFFKRIDSSGLAFLLTVYRHILRNAVFIYAIENKLPLPISDENSLPEEYTEDEDLNKSLFGDTLDPERVIHEEQLISFPKDMDVYMRKAKEYYDIITAKNNCSWIDSKYFKRTLKQQLNKDCEILLRMITLCGDWNPATDPKLNELEELLNGKHNSEKVIVFTQFSDTASYIFRQLKKRGFAHIACVTGDSKNPTDIVEHFSPKSNDKSFATDEQYRILIATDVLSEGQNLQDSHVITNFDLPWAIIRLIQRAGRVDRIGQESEQIYCYSFFPADGVEKIINLRGRLNDRINENANIVGSDEIFFEGNEQNLRDMFNEKSGSLDDDDDSDVDLSSQAYQIWKNATDANPRLKEIIPSLSNVIYATKPTEDAMQNGVITYAKTHNDFDVLTWLDANGNIISQSQKRILNAMSCNANTANVEPHEKHHELVAKTIEAINNETTSIGGILGNRFSTRYRISNLLERYYQNPPTLFFSQENKDLLKLAIDDIYNYPLLESAKFTLGRMLRNSNSDEIVECVLEMRKNFSLCRIDEDKSKRKEPSIICSMGLKYQS
ncbi:MAG: helicase [Paludibacteraceae bacterium]|nr:helicase [Paludibacteraceae bacterium]